MVASARVLVLVNDAFAAFNTNTIGKRRKLIGFEAKYNGEVIGTFETRDKAQAELDRIAFELAQVAA